MSIYCDSIVLFRKKTYGIRNLFNMCSARWLVAKLTKIVFAIEIYTLQYFFLNFYQGYPIVTCIYNIFFVIFSDQSTRQTQSDKYFFCNYQHVLNLGLKLAKPKIHRVHASAVSDWHYRPGSLRCKNNLFHKIVYRDWCNNECYRAWNNFYKMKCMPKYF